MATDAGWLPLSIAVEHQQGPEALEVIRLLLQAHPAATRVTNCDGWTATHLAACHQRGPKSLEVIALLLAAAPHSVRWHTHKDWLPLHVCTEHQKDELALPTVTMIAEACPDAAKQPNSDGWLPLHLAVGHQRGTESVKVAELLADLNPKALSHTTNRGSTPLHIASQNQRGPHAAAMLSLLHERQPGMARAVNHDGDLPIDLLVINVGHGLNNAPGGGAARELQEAVLVLVRAYPEGAARAIELRRIAPALRTTVMDGLLSTAPLSALGKELGMGGWSLGHALRRELWQAVVLPKGGPDGRPSREVSAAREPITAGICTFVAAMLGGTRRRVMTRLDPASASAWELAEKEEGADTVVGCGGDDAARSHAISAAAAGGERRIAMKDVVRKVDAPPTSSSASSASRGGIGVIIPSSRTCNTGQMSGAERPSRPSALSRAVRPDLPRPRLTYLYSRRHADVYVRFADHVDACEAMRARPDCLRHAPGATPAQRLALAALARHFVHLCHDETAFAVVVPVWLPLSPAVQGEARACPAASASFGCDRDLEARIVASVAPAKRNGPVRAWLTPEAAVQDALTSAISTGASVLGRVQVVLALAVLGAVRPVTQQGGGVEAALDALVQRRQAAGHRAAAAAAEEGAPPAKRARCIRLVEEDADDYSEALGGAWSGALPQVHYVRLQPDLSTLATDLLAPGEVADDIDDLVARAAREGAIGFEQLQLPADALLPVGVVDL
jgi:ankyrin repeat protein